MYFTDGTPTRATTESAREAAANIASALIEAGVMPSAEQLNSLGMTEQQAQSYMMAKGLQTASSSSRPRAYTPKAEQSETPATNDSPTASQKEKNKAAYPLQASDGTRFTNPERAALYQMYLDGVISKSTYMSKVNQLRG